MSLYFLMNGKEGQNFDCKLFHSKFYIWVDEHYSKSHPCQLGGGRFFYPSFYYFHPFISNTTEWKTKTRWLIVLWQVNPSWVILYQSQLNNSVKYATKIYFHNHCKQVNNNPQKFKPSTVLRAQGDYHFLRDFLGWSYVALQLLLK